MGIEPNSRCLQSIVASLGTCVPNLRVPVRTLFFQTCIFIEVTPTSYCRIAVKMGFEPTT